MVIINSKKPSDSSSTEGSDSSSDDDKKRFYKQPNGPRQTSSSSSPESNTDQSSGDGDPPASSVPRSKRAPQAKVRDPSPAMKAKKDGKRNREEEGGHEQAPAKRKNTPRKTDSGKKPSPPPPAPAPRQRETLPKGNAEKTPVKSVKEKKSSGSKDEKNPRRQIVQEAAVTTPAKKAQHLWSDKDEMVFANALVACLKRGIDISKNLAQVHQDVKDSMEHEYTKGQLYEKLRRLKNKYHTIMDKLKEGNVKEDSFPFKTPHEKQMFRICKQLWYEDPAADEDEEMEESPPKDAGRLVNPEVLAEEGDANDNTGGDSGDSQDEEEDQEDGNPAAANAQQGDKIMPVNRNGNGSILQQDEKLALMDGLNELRTDCLKMIEAAEARTAAFVEKQFKSARESLQRGDGGIRPGLALSIINRELMDGIHSTWEFPSLDGVKAERLEQKWRELRIVEMEVFSRRLDLLKEECKMCLEVLKSPTANGRS